MTKESLLHQGENLQFILYELEQLLNQSVSISRKGVIHKTIANNPQIGQVIQLIEAKKSQISAEKRELNPTPTFSRTPEKPILGKKLSTSIENYKDDQCTNLTNTNAAFAAACLNWNFLDPVRNSSARKSISSLDSQELILNILCRSLDLDAQLVYYKLIENRNIINIHSSIYEKNRRSLSAILGQYKGGIISLGDVAQQQTLLLNQLNVLLTLVAKQIELASELVVLIGIPPGTSALPSQERIDNEEWPLSLEETMQQGLQLRKEIQLAFSDSKAADWQAKTILNKYLSVLSLSINGYGRCSEGLLGSNAVNRSSQDRVTTQETDLAIGLGLTWTPFDSGSNLASSNSFKDQAKADLLYANFQRGGVGSQIRDSYGEYLTAKIALAKAEQALKIASLAVDIASERCSAGIGIVTTVVQSTEMHGRAALILFKIRVTYFDSIAKLYRYSGQWPSAYKQSILDGLSWFKVGSNDMEVVY